MTSEYSEYLSNIDENIGSSERSLANIVDYLEDLCMQVKYLRESIDRAVLLNTFVQPDVLDDPLARRVIQSLQDDIEKALSRG